MGDEDDIEDGVAVPNGTVPTEPDDTDAPVETPVAQEPDEGEEEAAYEAAPQRPIGRLERTVLAAKQAAREAKEEAERSRRELEEYRKQQSELRVNPAEEQARLAAMDPEERINYRIEQAQRANTAALRNLELSFKEQADKAAFAVRVAQDPSLRKYEAKVDAIYAEHMANAKRNGTPPPDRATILPWVIGQEVLKGSAKAVDKSRKAGAANIARQTTKPVSARGDVPASGGGGKGKWDHLLDVKF